MGLQIQFAILFAILLLWSLQDPVRVGGGGGGVGLIGPAQSPKRGLKCVIPPPHPVNHGSHPPPITGLSNSTDRKFGSQPSPATPGTFDIWPIWHKIIIHVISQVTFCIIQRVQSSFISWWLERKHLLLCLTIVHWNISTYLVDFAIYFWRWSGQDPAKKSSNFQFNIFEDKNTCFWLRTSSRFQICHLFTSTMCRTPKHCKSKD